MKNDIKIDGIAIAAAMILFYASKVFGFNNSPWYYIMAPLAFYAVLMTSFNLLDMGLESISSWLQSRKDK